MTRTRATHLQLWSDAEASAAWELSTDDLRATIVAHGAHLVQVHQRSGDDWIPVSVDYPIGATRGGFHGATVGRWANRIGGSAYTHDGTTYRLDANDGANQLHGGPDGFDCRDWRVVDVGDLGAAGRGVTLELMSPDGDQGFPGQVRATARFALIDATILIEYEAQASEPTPLNVTSHCYWNLGGVAPLDGHQLRVNADHYIAVDDGLIPVQGPAQKVASTRFDCRTPRELSEVVDGGGYDHCFVLDAITEQVALVHRSGRRLRIETDQPGLQVYTGQHLHPGNRGIALETQRLPDGPNRPDFGPAVTKDFRSSTTLRFDHV